MKRLVRNFVVFGCVLSSILCADAAVAQKSGGILKVYHRDSPASASIHEEATISSVAPFMGVFNNLVMFKQDEKQNRDEFIARERELQCQPLCRSILHALYRSRRLVCIKRRSDRKLLWGCHVRPSGEFTDLPIDHDPV